jgi:hypothetical protein
MSQPDFQVRMESDEYGEEVFNYPSRKEALQGFSRVTAQAREHSARDGVVRHLELLEVIEQERTE